jgi:4-alpha-glucanotransferase
MNGRDRDWQQRAAGVLLHPTSLPSRLGIGNLGPASRRYLRWLAEAGVGWWQVLPLNPPGPGCSPYSATSAFATSDWLLSPEDLVDDGLLDEADLHELGLDPGDAAGDEALVSSGTGAVPAGQVDYGAVARSTQAMLERAHSRFRQGRRPELAAELDAFCELHRGWLEDFALFTALKVDLGGAPWFEWPPELVLRRPEALARARTRLADEIETVELAQLLLARQIGALREEAARLGVRILGDAPIFVAADSADVWSRPELFRLDEERRPLVVAGVPPDYFSATGQLWGNPVYDWDRLRDEGFRWWVERVQHALTTVDALRIDHFRGFVASWAVPADAEDAIEGRWMPGPGRELFDALAAELGGLPLVAEDLGDITPDVVQLRQELGLPGMAILQFGFCPEPRSTFLPYNHTPDMVVYTGTHDNNTTVGWLVDDAGPGERDLALRYAGADPADGLPADAHWSMVRLAMASVAWLAVVPHQDLVGLGTEARMNLPGSPEGNWRVRLAEAHLDEAVQRRLAEQVWVFGRGRPTMAWREER